jgi:hypothetical protein
VILPDANVLVHAFRADSPDHKKCRLWLKSVVGGDMAYGMSPQVLGAVVRIVTHPRIFVPPTPLEEALAFANLLLDQPHCQLIQPGPRHWGIFRDVCRRERASGNLVPDAWFAALAIESGCEWITMDRDYARFEGLRWREPFQA